MAMGWSSEAQAILLSNRIEGRLQAWIDVEYGGAYGLNVIEVTDRVIDWGELERASSAIDQNFNTCQVILRLRNDDSYFTPNFMSGPRDTIANVWSVRPSGEARFRDCRVYIDFGIKLSDGSWETIRMSRAAIGDLSLMDQDMPVCELILKDMAFDALDKILTLADGPNVEYTL